MIQLDILSGKTAGQKILVRRFPFRIGRTKASQLVLEDTGVWDQHAEIVFNRGDGFVICTPGDALLVVNGQRVKRAIVRSGDEIDLGAVRMRFWLAPVKQKSLKPREVLTWMALLGLFAAQLYLIQWLLD